jgi:hypothetical protein
MRLDRRPYRTPWIYFGAMANGQGEGGCHFHLLLWEYLHLDALLGDVGELGLGGVDLKQVQASEENYIGTATIARYVLGQHEPVFGSKHHQRHQPRTRHQWRWLRRHSSLLAEENPKLLSAIEWAQDRSLTDEELVLRLPWFSTSKGTPSYSTILQARSR